MRTIVVRRRLPIPFDLEPSLFEPPYYTIYEAEHRRRLREQYDAVREWHAARDELERQGYVVVEQDRDHKK